MDPHPMVPDGPPGREADVTPRRLARGVTIVLMLVFAALVVTSLVPMLSASKGTGMRMPGRAVPQTSTTSSPGAGMPGMSMPGAPQR